MVSDAGVLVSTIIQVQALSDEVFRALELLKDVPDCISDAREIVECCLTSLHAITARYPGDGEQLTSESRPVPSTNALIDLKGFADGLSKSLDRIKMAQLRNASA